MDIIVHVQDAFLHKHRLEKGSVAPAGLDTIKRLIDESHSFATHTPGGSCANVMRALARLGWNCSLTGKIGNDELGDILLKDLDQYAIVSDYHKTDQPTGCVLCLVTPDGERTMRDYLGASATMCGKDLAQNLFKNTSHVHIEGYSLFNEGVTKTAMEKAHQAKNTVSFDLANFKIVQRYKESILELLTQYVDIVFCNAQEAEALLELSAEESCKKLSKLCNHAIVTMGKRGSWVAHINQIIHIPAIPVKHVLDTTGAGDLYSAGYLDGFLKGLPIEKCGKQGAFLAAEVLTQEGAVLPSDRWPVVQEYFNALS